MRILQGVFRLSSCSWLTLRQRINVESCIKALSEISKTRGIAIPVDLDNQVSSLFQKQNHLISKHTRVWLSAARGNAAASGKKSALTLEIPNQNPTFKNGKSIIEGLQDIVSLLEEQLKPLVQAELSVLVDVLYKPELLFPLETSERQKCANGGFISRLISHTERLLEEKEERLCIKVLQTLKEMMALDPDYEEKVLKNFSFFYKELSFCSYLLFLLLH